VFESVEQFQCFGVGHAWTDAVALEGKMQMIKINQNRLPTMFECFV
jgi:hypothetical protein